VPVARRPSAPFCRLAVRLTLPRGGARDTSPLLTLYLHSPLAQPPSCSPRPPRCHRICGPSPFLLAACRRLWTHPSGGVLACRPVRSRRHRRLRQRHPVPRSPARPCPWQAMHRHPPLLAPPPLSQSVAPVPVRLPPWRRRHPPLNAGQSPLRQAKLLPSPAPHHPWKGRRRIRHPTSLPRCRRPPPFVEALPVTLRCSVCPPPPTPM